MATGEQPTSELEERLGRPGEPIPHQYCLGPDGLRCAFHDSSEWEVLLALGPAAPDCPAQDPLIFTTRIARVSVNPAFLARLAANVRDATINRAVAANRKTHFATLHQLASHVDPNVRSAVAGNPSTPVTALEDLSLDEDRGVRLSIARNIATSLVALSLLQGTMPMPRSGVRPGSRSVACARRRTSG